ncbi:hypothetical protein [Bacillus sp. PK3_68]|uniref:hypothetical protein n=1 Tax=Bacillus sp. PK3_68 TaxID=2027408 RepID=UPI00115C86C5|nr:hypothetical protein [Bacillus sp. PK3_68]
MSEFIPGKVISFRLPRTTPKRVLSHLEDLKSHHGRKFSSVLSSKLVQMLDEEIKKEKPDDMLVIPIPSGISQDEREFLQNEKNQALIGQLITHLLKEPDKMVTLPETEQTIEPKLEEKSYIQNKALQSFAQKTFLNFDDDDDD